MRQDSPPALPSTFTNSLRVQVLRHRVSFFSQMVTLWKGGRVPQAPLVAQRWLGSSLPQRHFSSHLESDANPKCLSPTGPRAPAASSGPLPDSDQLTHVDTEGRMAMVDTERTWARDSEHRPQSPRLQVPQLVPLSSLDGQIGRAHV